MKKIVVVTKKGVDPAKEGAMNFAKGNTAFQLQLKKVYDDQEGIQEINLLTENPRLQQLKDEMNRTFTIEVDENNETEIIKLLEEQGMFERIEPDEKNFQYGNPNDPLFASLYGIKKIEADVVWNSGNMGEEVLVAVVDSGIDIDHEDLKDNLWNDGNGNHGFNVINGTFNLTDESRHGTHVSGTIGAVVNNQKGVAGVAPKCRIMTIKGLDGPNGSGDASNLANGIKKAVDNGARVINNSWGPGRSTDVQQAIEYAYLHGVVVVFAAGNNNSAVSRNDAAGNPYVICVGATDSNDLKGSFSNHGQLVTVSAPGVSILSTIPGNNYDSFNGTSMAAPHVSGLAALVLSKNKSLKVDGVKDLISKNCDPFASNPPQPMGAGRINANRTLAATP